MPETPKPERRFARRGPATNLRPAGAHKQKDRTPRVCDQCGDTHDYTDTYTDYPDEKEEDLNVV